MSRSPQFKVYSPQGEYIGCCKDAEDAAALVGLRGEGSVVKYNHKIVIWREGQEEVEASVSYDGAAEIMLERIDSYRATYLAGLRG